MMLSQATKSPEESQSLISHMVTTGHTGSLKMTGKSNLGKSI